MTRTTTPEYTRPPQIREYGCVKCQSYHSEGDPLFADHLFHQSKHGWRWCQATPAEHLRIVMNQEAPSESE